MKKQFIVRAATVLLLTVLLGVSLTGWNQRASSVREAKDTIPKTRDRQIKSLDDALEDLDRYSLELDRIKIPGIESIDVPKIRADVEKALKEIDAVKLKTEIDKSFSKIDFDKMKTEITKIKEIELPKMEMEMKNLRPQIEASIAEAKKSIEKANTEIKEYKAFEDGLEKDGLINKSDYSIEYYDGVLKINDKIQPAEVYNKYKSFLDKHKDFEMHKNADGFNIRNRKDN
jgi:hypothetical protein